MTDAEQFVTFRIPNVDEAVAADLDPSAWEPVLSIDNDEHRLALALNAELPIRVPTWTELGLTRKPSEPGIYRGEGIEAERRRDDTWEVWISTDDPYFICPTFDTEVEARWFVAELVRWAA